MEDILNELGMEDLYPKFMDNEVGPKEVLDLDDEEWTKLGVYTIGKRSKLKCRCRIFLDGKREESPIVRAVREASARRRGKATRSAASGSSSTSSVSVKPTLRLHVGWKHSNSDGVFVLISSKKGGGTHMIDFKRNKTLVELQTNISELYFPNGVSREQGLHLKEMQSRLATFNGQILPEILENGQPFTVEGFYSQVKRSPVRIYLETIIDQPGDTDVGHNLPVSNSKNERSINIIDELPDINNISDDEFLSSPPWAQDTNQRQPNLQTNQIYNRNLPIHDVVHVCDISQEYTEAGTPTVLFRSGSETNNDTCTSSDPGFELLKGFQVLSNSLLEEASLKIRRCHMLEDITKAYADDPKLPLKGVQVEFIGEIGDDFGGLTKDLYTNVWKLLQETYFIGEDAMVPYLPVHKVRRDKDTFVLIGKILAHTAALLQILPPRLSRCSLFGIVFGEESVSEDLLLEDFLLYLVPSDRLLVNTSLKNFDSLNTSQMEKLVNFFTIYNLQETPNATKVKEQILSIAQNVLIDRPAPLLSKLKQGIPTGQMDMFWSLLTEGGVNYLYQQQGPTVRRFLHIISTSPADLHPEEEKALYLFKQYVGGLDQEELAELLLFITGSTVMADQINITFRSVTGVMRCPVAHTCSNLLELPSSYSSFHELKREFRAVLSSVHSFEMTIM